MKQSLCLLLCAMTLILSSCLDEQTFPTPADARIAFSADTLDFDTVIINRESPTVQFSVYNKSSKGIRITSVAFEGKDKDAFLANVHGFFIQPGIPVSIDCAGKDSITAFAQFNAQDNDNDQAVISEADLVFTLANGVSQKVHVMGYSQAVVELRGKTFTSDATLQATRPFAVYDSLVVKPGATLTIAPGSTLLFASDAGIKVEGTLVAKGTQEEPIVFRGNRYDNMFKNQPYDRIDNQWQGIRLTSSSYDNHLDHCDIHSGNYGITCDSADQSRLKLKLENSVLHNVRRNALTIDQCQVFVGNTQISNAENNCVDVTGGHSTFVHCTIGWFSPFSTRQGNALVFTNHKGDNACPISQLTFYNSIITGHNSDEIFAYTSSNESISNNYAFYNCLLNTPEIKDKPNVVNNVWENRQSTVKQAANFVNFDYSALIYDFRLAADSPARFIADPAITQQYYPLDRLGTPRLTNNLPDAGCYQYVEIPTE